MAISLHTKLYDMSGTKYHIMAVNNCLDVVAMICNFHRSASVSHVVASEDERLAFSISEYILPYCSGKPTQTLKSGEVI